MVRFALAAVLATLAAPASAGPCAIPMLYPVPMLAPGSIAPDGGVLVMLSSGFGGGVGKSDGKLAQAGWSYKVGKQTVAPPAIHELAPGLATYDLPATGDALTLTDGKRDLIAVTRAPAQPALSAPSIKSVDHVLFTSGSGYRSYQTTTVTVELAAAPPAGAVAMIIYTAGKAPAVATSWGRIADPKSKSVMVYASGGRCSLPPPGTAETPIGTTVAVAWVDASGRVSPKSKELVVRRGSQPARNGIN